MANALIDSNQVSVITGATSGIGRVAAEILAERGDTVVLVGRNPERGRIAVEQIRAETGNRRLSFIAADLARLSEVHRLATTIRERHSRLNVLINNAGALFPQRTETADGLEKTFALNHMAYFLLSNLLVEPLAQGGSARVINVASTAHQNALLDFNDLQLRHGYRGWTAYKRSKLANILFTREFSRRHHGKRIIAASLHPGFIASRFGDETGGLFQVMFGLAKRLFAESQAIGGERVASLAAGPLPITGGYYANNKLVSPSAAAQSDGDAARLWEISLELCHRWME